MAFRPKGSVYTPRVAKNSMRFGLELTGMKTLIDTLRDKLPREVIDAAAGKALAAAAEPMVSSAKAHALKVKDTGLLADSIIARSKVYKSRRTKGDAKVIAKLWVGADNKKTGVRKRGRGPLSKVTPQNPGKYAHLVEFGTHRSAAKPFMRPAFAESKGAAEAAVGSEFEKSIARACKKLKIPKGAA